MTKSIHRFGALVLVGLFATPFAPAFAAPDATGAPDAAGSAQKAAVSKPESASDRKGLDRLVAGKSKVTPDSINAATFEPPPSDGKAVSAAVVKAEVLLDRAHASPGVIDGKAGQNLKNAIAAFETTHDLPVDGVLSQRVWTALTADTKPVIARYVITQADAAYPYTPDIPSDYGKMAKMKALNYRNAYEMFGERFHMDQDLLQILNPGVDMTKAGNAIEVADVASPPLRGRIVRIDVDKEKGQVRAYDAHDKLVVAYPATVGSDELPSPSGTHKVKGVARHPVYSYDPQKNFQQGHNTEKLTIPAGPNNPVGAVYIALSKPTYGIHGTPDPSKIDKSSSHGCVRLPNWDAQELAAHVRPGVVVHFLGADGA